MNIGIVGGGQLARMLALAGIPLGFRFQVLDPAMDACAGVAASLITAPYDDPAGLATLAQQCDVVTFDFENVPESAACWLAERVAVHPSPTALAAAQDRLQEKTLFQSLGIPTAPFQAVDSYTGLEDAVATIGLPAILKTRRLGYDGKGQYRLRQPEDIARAWQQLAGSPLLLEGWVPFEREVSLLTVRNSGEAIAHYPLVENSHCDGILRLSRAPYEDAVLSQQAHHYGERLLEQLGYVGLLAVEFFVCEGRLLANEMAPRVHNSGHWTLEGAAVSQFENHLRAVTGLPLGATTAVPTAMVNFIGQLPAREAILAHGAHFHDYGKSPRPGRKVGHGTLVDPTDASLARLQSLADGTV